MSDKVTWKILIDEVLEELNEPLIASTLSPEELNREFDCGYGLKEGVPFTAWSENWVLFPIDYDGSESVGRAPRNPCGIKMFHQGGGG
jgi:hypothetical protein